MTSTLARGRRPRTSALPVAAALLAIACLLVTSVPAALAEGILQLTGPVTDSSGVLAGDEADIEDAIERTLDEHGVQVFVLFVNTTDGAPTADYAAETAQANSLGVDDALLLVAIEDRTDYIWVSDGLDEVTDDELDEIIGGTLEPALRDGDFEAAAIATVEAIGEAADSAAPTSGPIVPGPIVTAPPAEPAPGEAPAGSGIGLGTILALLLVGGGGFLVYRQWRRGRAAAGDSVPAPTGPAAAEPALSGEELARQANALLIATDERIRDARQEVDFAEAQYGPDEVGPLRAAVASAQDELRAAFTLRQRLDDAVPEDEAARDAMRREIVERTTQAQDDPRPRNRPHPPAARPGARCPEHARATPGQDRGGRGPVTGGTHHVHRAAALRPVGLATRERAPRGGRKGPRRGAQRGDRRERRDEP